MSEEDETGFDMNFNIYLWFRSTGFIPEIFCLFFFEILLHFLFPHSKASSSLSCVNKRTLAVFVGYKIKIVELGSSDSD